MIANRAYGGFGLVGGKREKEDASPKETLIREIGEELGIMGVKPKDLAIVHQGVGDLADVWLHFFLVRSLAAQLPEVGIGGEEIRLVTFEELCEIPPFGPYFRQHFPDGWDHLRRTVCTFG